ncbi:MAG: urease accessory protein UreE [Oscillatoriaceae cyanobacterium]
MLIFTQILPPDASGVSHYNLALTADDRTRSRHRFTTEEGETVSLNLPRGTILQHGDRLASETGETVLLITAKPEPILTVTAHHPLDLLRAAYHLGNRHVSLEINPDYLRLSPDSVLKSMLQQMELQVIEEIAPFFPETGAYHHHHNHE